MKAGLIDNADRQVTIGFFANTSCNRFGEIVRPIRLEPDGTEKYRGNFLMTLDASLGRCLNYQKHRIYFGAHGNFDLTFPVESDSYLTFLEIPGKIQFENKFVTGTVKFPVTLDINLFGSTVGAIINISPSINGLWALSPTVTDPYNYVKLSVSQLSLGLRGKVGDRFEFSIILVEIKAVITLEDVHLAQTLNYLTAYQLPIGLLINFGAPKLQFKRMFRKDS